MLPLPIEPGDFYELLKRGVVALERIADSLGKNEEHIEKLGIAFTGAPLEDLSEAIQEISNVLQGDDDPTSDPTEEPS